MEHRTVSLRCGPNRYEVTVPEGVRFQYAALRPAHRPEDPAAAVRAAVAGVDNHHYRALPCFPAH